MVTLLTALVSTTVPILVAIVNPETMTAWDSSGQAVECPIKADEARGFVPSVFAGEMKFFRLFVFRSSDPSASLDGLNLSFENIESLNQTSTSPSR